MQFMIMLCLLFHRPEKIPRPISVALPDRRRLCARQLVLLIDARRRSRSGCGRQTGLHRRGQTVLQAQTAPVRHRHRGAHQKFARPSKPSVAAGPTHIGPAHQRVHRLSDEASGHVSGGRRVCAVAGLRE